MAYPGTLFARYRPHKALAVVFTIATIIALGWPESIAPAAQAPANARQTTTPKETRHQQEPNRSAPKSPPTYEPEVAIQVEDYAQARKGFQTKLLRKSPAPQKAPKAQAPAGVSEVVYTSGELRLKAWLYRPADSDSRKLPAVLFLHGGFAFEKEDWEVAKPYRDAGYVVMAPILRGENGQPGAFSMFYDELDDVLAAADYLSKQSSVDANRVFVAGPSAGGTLALLAAMASPHFRAAASFSGSPDQVLLCKYARQKKDIPFNYTDPRELQMRSPLAYSASFKCPARIYFGTEEPHFRLTSQRMAALAKEKGLNVEALQIKGGHASSVPAAMKQSIEFFEKR